MTLAVRPLIAADRDALRAVLNDIIATGGTTAHEDPFTADGFAAHLAGARVVHVVLDGGAPVGLQYLAEDPRLPAGWLAIATFTRRAPPVPGAGRALFAATSAWARGAGVTAIDATIRADNTGGLAYYGRMGFETYRTWPAVPLRDGTPVDRIAKAWRP
ncbi:GNAT family N-acetyltransferase [Frigidibacter sp. MR17.24]|uniref:GNAT family N-acetyltransferase n=1 Tax=Frigidibacter sp. MR17.24 TaxID=3127345 RepID=UPI0030130481